MSTNNPTSSTPLFKVSVNELRYQEEFKLGFIDEVRGILKSIVDDMAEA